MELNIEGKVAVITGGDSGIGLETAKFLVKEGVKIVLSDIDKEELEKAADEVRALAKDKNDVITIVADLAENEQVVKMAETVKQKFGGASMLINCAGARGAAGDFLELTDDDWMKTIEIDLLAAVRLCRAFIPQMLENKWGRVILIASENALQPYEEESPYNACKAAIINLSKCLSRAYSAEDILINTVSPAYVETPMTDAMMEELAKERGTSEEEAVKWFVKNKRPYIAMQRRGKPKEVASVIAFLCSEHATYVNGSNVRVDGGAVETAFG
ncbi:NAD(P)-dependent dehydrogenase, short-chain alcohol dehydrogenase family [Catalinimonas alkaloidigena]|uniref:NAD(P)-dependent dehydrogenase, short-chain alcohol dehydrogenase family n=1 Tax=Catalinimonas alkaloidigena TaxID=1075417 RepID=A0A1G8XRK4_9BACT|nr:SDR family NAD(P)-dependent oxidoreductase [Catalinimonas alkaloidigena]SDJ92814.1 NAD(P)-dependent dehydrogenase, short-chain alcohol dehydrogenase family [Catalinimonas alkaloidigena]